jgi:hypothetical protein
VWVTASTVNQRAPALCQIAGMYECYCTGQLSNECFPEVLRTMASSRTRKLQHSAQPQACTKAIAQV